MKKAFNLSSLAVVILLSGCNTEMPIEQNSEVNGENICRMTFETDKPSFEGTNTRSGESGWNNGDCIYLNFMKTDNTVISGKAVYNAADEYWSLEYSGTIGTITDGTCFATYLEGSSEESSENVTFSATTCIYQASGKYSKTSSGVTVNAHLIPIQSRIRFTGTAGKKFTISGPAIYTELIKKNSNFRYLNSTQTSISQDGSSPYIYATFYGMTDHTLTVSYDKLSFSMMCESPVLDDGKSGYMKLPTKNNHSGWSMVETTVPVVGDVSVSNVEANSASFEASIISNGNAAIIDCGFVYAKTENPTLNNQKVGCSASSFKATANNLAKNTNYYVRAYATNEEGTTYGPQTSFKTTAGKIAVTNGMTAYYMFENNFDDATDNHYDGFGMNNPIFVDGIESGGYAVKFTSQSYMRVGFVLNEAKTHSTTFWIKEPTDGCIFATLTNGKQYKGPTMSLELENGQLRYVIDSYYNSYDSYRGDIGCFTHPSITDGKWHHIAIVTDYGVIAYGKWGSTLYIDGKQMDVISQNQSSDFCGISFQLGGTFDHYGTKYTGAPMTIDNFRTYTRCLTADEVKEIYNSEKQ